MEDKLQRLYGLHPTQAHTTLVSATPTVSLAYCRGNVRVTNTHERTVSFWLLLLHGFIRTWTYKCAPRGEEGAAGQRVRETSGRTGTLQNAR